MELLHPALLEEGSPFLDEHVGTTAGCILHVGLLWLVPDAFVSSAAALCFTETYGGSLGDFSLCCLYVEVFSLPSRVSALLLPS